MTLTHVIEALVFASPKPMLTKEIVAALRTAGETNETPEAQEYAKLKEPEVIAALEELQLQFSQSGRAFQLVERVNGWTFVSDPMCAIWVRQLYPEAKPTRLTGPQLETLAIIAYRQPVTRADIEAVRGVAVDGVMQVLLDRGLVKIAGRAEVPGRPLLYSTTEYFLQHFGLKTTDDLPNAGELKRVPLPSAATVEADKAKKDGAAPAQPAAAPGPTPDTAVAEPTEAAPASEPAESAPVNESAEPAEIAEPEAEPEPVAAESETPEPNEHGEPDAVEEAPEPNEAAEK